MCGVYVYELLYSAVWIHELKLQSVHLDTMVVDSAVCLDTRLKWRIIIEQMFSKSFTRFLFLLQSQKDIHRICIYGVSNLMSLPLFL